jgi:hypothetical protein
LHRPKVPYCYWVGVPTGDTPKLGGVAATSRKYPKLLIGADGVVPEPTSFEMHLERCRLWNHPAAAIRGSGFHLLTAAAAPPNLGGDTCIPSLADRLNLPMRAARENLVAFRLRRAGCGGSLYRGLRCALTPGLPRTAPRGLLQALSSTSRLNLRVYGLSGKSSTVSTSNVTLSIRFWASISRRRDSIEWIVSRCCRASSRRIQACEKAERRHCPQPHLKPQHAGHKDFNNGVRNRVEGLVRMRCASPRNQAS